MAEFTESASTLLEAVRGGSEALARDALESFTRDLGEMGVREGRFVLETEEGGLRILNDGRVVDLEQAVDALKNYGDIEASLRALRVPENIINLPEVQEYTSSYKVRWNNQPGIVDINTYEKLAEDSRVLEESYGSPNNVDEVTKAVETNPELSESISRKLDDLRKKVRESGTRGVRVGRWIKRGVLVGVGIITAVVLYNEILKHKKVMNGCWLVDIKTGEKCKIQTMSCDIGEESTQYMCGEFNVCGPNNLSPCFHTDTCIEYDEEGRCNRRLGQCTTGKCSQYCTHGTTEGGREDTTIDLPPGKKLVCVNVNFWGAAEDFLQDSLLGIGGNLMWYLVIGVLIVVGVVVLINVLRK